MGFCTAIQSAYASAIARLLGLMVALLCVCSGNAYGASDAALLEEMLTVNNPRYAYARIGWPPAQFEHKVKVLIWAILDGHVRKTKLKAILKELLHDSKEARVVFAGQRLIHPGKARDDRDAADLDHYFGDSLIPWDVPIAALRSPDEATRLLAIKQVTLTAKWRDPEASSEVFRIFRTTTSATEKTAAEGFLRYLHVLDGDDRARVAAELARASSSEERDRIIRFFYGPYAHSGAATEVADSIRDASGALSSEMSAHLRGYLTDYSIGNSTIRRFAMMALLPDLDRDPKSRDAMFNYLNDSWRIDQVNLAYDEELSVVVKRRAELDARYRARLSLTVGASAYHFDDFVNLLGDFAGEEHLIADKLAEILAKVGWYGKKTPDSVKKMIEILKPIALKDKQVRKVLFESNTKLYAAQALSLAADQDATVRANLAQKLDESVFWAEQCQIIELLAKYAKSDSRVRDGILAKLKSGTPEVRAAAEAVLLPLAAEDPTLFLQITDGIDAASTVHALDAVTHSLAELQTQTIEVKPLDGYRVNAKPQAVQVPLHLNANPYWQDPAVQARLIQLDAGDPQGDVAQRAHALLREIAAHTSPPPKAVAQHLHAREKSIAATAPSSPPSASSGCDPANHKPWLLRTLSGLLRR